MSNWPNDRVEKLMKTLDLTREEAIQLLEDDKAVDRMKDSEVNSDLTVEQQKATKKARQADRKPFVPNLTQRERKPNDAKRAIMAILETAVATFSDNESMNITNPEREMEFRYLGVKYKLVLSAPRK